eukprot:TRINITY_DN3813_c0_g1_i1.p1 TRINITY_DN3813_c0_g1~~TRINITY_DN3813_c0_g1_i1.p1  ORF type:complete len:322 (+),score=62.63 TRINITY_DN3813_c0_g1_i1:34-999(+)
MTSGRLAVLVFSLTGNTRHVCERVARDLVAAGAVSTEVEWVDLTRVTRGEVSYKEVAAAVERCDVLCVGWLCWHLTECPGVLELLLALPDKAISGKPALLVCTAGGDPGDGFERLTGELAMKGCTVVDTLFVAAPTNFVLCMPDKPFRQTWGSVNTNKIATFAATLTPKLQNFAHGSKPTVVPTKHYCLAGNMAPYLGEFKFDKAKCVKCAVCARSCPYNAIALDVEQYPVRRADKCRGCCRCINLCPHNAISISGLGNRATYRFDENVLVPGDNSYKPTMCALLVRVAGAAWAMHPRARHTVYAVAAVAAALTGWFLIAQ